MFSSSGLRFFIIMYYEKIKKKQKKTFIIPLKKAFEDIIFKITQVIFKQY